MDRNEFNRWLPSWMRDQAPKPFLDLALSQYPAWASGPTGPEVPRREPEWDGWVLPVHVVGSKPKVPDYLPFRYGFPVALDPTETPHSIHLTDKDENQLVADWLEHGMIGRLVKRDHDPITVEYCPMEEDGQWGITWYKTDSAQ